MAKIHLTITNDIKSRAERGELTDEERVELRECIHLRNRYLTSSDYYIELLMKNQRAKDIKRSKHDKIVL